MVGEGKGKEEEADGSAVAMEACTVTLSVKVEDLIYFNHLTLRSSYQSSSSSM